MIDRPARAVAIVVAAACSHPPGPTPGGTKASSDETLAFDVTDGDIHNHFFRRGPIAAHLLVSSGLHPRLIVAFPAGNTGIGVWFEEAKTPVRFDAQTPLSGLAREDGMRGVVALLTADTDRLAVRGAV